MESNGATSAGALQAHLARAEATREGIVQSMRQLLADEEELHEQLSAQATEAKARRDHLRRALDHLTGETRKYKPRQSSEPRSSREQEPGPRPHQEALDEIVQALREHPGATHTELCALVTPSTEVVTRALRHLRADDIVRVTGKPGKRGATYALMPEVLRDAAA